MTHSRNAIPSFHPLPRAFFERDTLSVARDLLGHRLLVRSNDSATPRVLRIVETEAYTQDDPACHAFGRTTGRASTLYLGAGLAYVYLIYGMYYCLNVTTEPAGRAGAVLFRALEPLADEGLRTHGPGRLTKALQITRDAHNEIDMTHPDSVLVLGEGESVPEGQIVQTTRIGITKGVELPWRFYIDANPWVSVKAKAVRNKRTASKRV